MWLVEQALLCFRLGGVVSPTRGVFWPSAFRRSRDSIDDLYTYNCTAVDFEYDSDGAAATLSVVPAAAATTPAWGCVRRSLRASSKNGLLGDERLALGERTARKQTYSEYGDEHICSQGPGPCDDGNGGVFHVLCVEAVRALVSRAVRLWLKDGRRPM